MRSEQATCVPWSDQSSACSSYSLMIVSLMWADARCYALRRFRVVGAGAGHRGQAAAARSSFSAPRMMILSASSGSGQSRHLQTMAECPHYGRVTWFSGSGQHFRRFNQTRQPDGAGIGTRYGAGHKNIRQRVGYASKTTKMLMLKMTPAAATTSVIRQKTPQFPMADHRSARTALQPCCAKSLRNG